MGVVHVAVLYTIYTITFNMRALTILHIYMYVSAIIWLIWEYYIIVHVHVAVVYPLYHGKCCILAIL